MRLAPPAWYAAEFLDIFLDRNTGQEYDSVTENFPIFFGPRIDMDPHIEEHYDLKNGIGLDVAPGSLVSGDIAKYIWEPHPYYPETQFGLAHEIRLEKQFWDQVIVPSLQNMINLQNMNIGVHYATHPDDDEEVFSYYFTEEFKLSEFNRGLAFGGCWGDLGVIANTRKNTGEDPVITDISIVGTIQDIYGWEWYTGNDLFGWVSRTEVCYAPSCGRTAGKVYMIEVDVSRSVPIIPAKKFDEYEYLWNAWYNYEIIGY